MKKTLTIIVFSTCFLLLLGAALYNSESNRLERQFNSTGEELHYAEQAAYAAVDRYEQAQKAHDQAICDLATHKLQSLHAQGQTDETLKSKIVDTCDEIPAIIDVVVDLESVESWAYELMGDIDDSIRDKPIQ